MEYDKKTKILRFSPDFNEELKDLPNDVEEIIFDDAPHRADAVAPADLLALRTAAGIEPDGQFQDRVPRAQQLRGDLGFDVETIRLEPQ